MIREMDLNIEDFRVEEKNEDTVEVYTKLYGTTLVIDELDAKIHPYVK